jgi:hypothetical protein
MPPSGLGHYAVVGIQEPPLLSAVFCQPIAIGGPGGAGLNFPAWPILVPTEDGVQVCFTPDENFRNTYLQRGFCGLDASFRDKFDYNCSAPIIHVEPSVGEENQDGSVEGDAPGDADPEQQDAKQDDSRETTTGWSFLGYLLAPAIRMCAGVWYVLSSCAKFIWDAIVGLCELFFTGLLNAASFIFLATLGISAAVTVVWLFGMVFYGLGLGSHPSDWNKDKTTDESQEGLGLGEHAEPAEDGSRADEEPKTDDESKPDNQQTAVNPLKAANPLKAVNPLTADNLQKVDSNPGPHNHLNPNNKPETNNQPNMTGPSLWGQAGPSTRTHAPVLPTSPPNLYHLPASSLSYPSGPSYPSYAAQPYSTHASYISTLRSAQQGRSGLEYDTDDSAGLTTPSSRGSQFPQYH